MAQSEAEANQLWSPPDYQSLNQGAIGYAENPFLVPESLKDEVQFWIDIYSKYTTRQGVFHLSGRTDQILGTIDLTDVYSNQQWSKIRQEKEAEVLIRRQKRRIAQENHIQNVNHVRLQMGLKDRMLEAIQLSGYYLPLMEKIFQEENLPVELTRVVFVESSFNIEAGSKVGANGLWQIMPRLAKKFKYLKPSYDLRRHPLYSTRLAARIFKENYQILKSWPLAVTAYNHGVGSLHRIVRKYKSNDINYLTENVHSKKSFGFASRNFYVTFLAALHVEANANLYFPEPLMKKSELKLRNVYLKKNMKYEALLDLFDQDRKKMKLYNPHIKSSLMKPGRSWPVSTLVNLPYTQTIELGAFRVDEQE